MFCFRGLKNVLESFGSFGGCASNKRDEFTESLGCAQQETNLLSVVSPWQRSAIGLIFATERERRSSSRVRTIGKMRGESRKELRERKFWIDHVSHVTVEITV